MEKRKVMGFVAFCRARHLHWGVKEPMTIHTAGKGKKTQQFLLSGSSSQSPQPNCLQNCNPTELLKLKSSKMFVRFFIPECSAACPGNFAVHKQGQHHKSFLHMTKPWIWSAATKHPPPKLSKASPQRSRVPREAGLVCLHPALTPTGQKETQQHCLSLALRTWWKFYCCQSPHYRAAVMDWTWRKQERAK